MINKYYHSNVKPYIEGSQSDSNRTLIDMLHDLSAGKTRQEYINPYINHYTYAKPADSSYIQGFWQFKKSEHLYNPKLGLLIGPTASRQYGVGMDDPRNMPKGCSLDNCIGLKTSHYVLKKIKNT